MQNNSTNTIDQLNADAWNNRFVSGRRSFEKARQALELATEEGYLKGKAEALIYTTMFAYWFSENVNYLETLLEAEDILLKLDERLILSRVQNLLAVVYDQYGQYEHALVKTKSSLEIAQEIGALSEASDASTTKGQIYLRLEDYQKAIKEFKKAYEIRVELNDQKALGSTLNLLARSHTLLKNYDDAVDYYTQSLEIREKANDTYGLPWTYLGLATVNLDRGYKEDAKGYFEKGLDLNKSTQDKRYDVVALEGLGKTHIKLNQHEKAGECFKKGYAKAVELNSKPLEADLAKELAKWYEAQKDFENAFKWSNSYINLKEEILNNESANRLRDQQIAFSVEESRRKAEIYQLRNVELKKALDEIDFQNRQILDSINYASRIQGAILPPISLINKYLSNSFIIFLPKDIVSGDFYWIKESQGKIIFTNADCTGHGVPGAFVSVIGKIGLDKAVSELGLSSPAAILKALNNFVTETFSQSVNAVKDGMDISLCAYDPGKKVLEYAGARNPLYLLRDKEITVFKGDRISIESSEMEPEFTNHEIQLEKGDRIYIFSDGYIDQFGGPENKKFMQKRLRQLLADTENEPLSIQETILLETFQNWKGTVDQIDDVSLFAFEV